MILIFQDNTKAVEEVLATSYPGYDLVTPGFNDIQYDHQHDSSLSSDDSEDGDDIDSDDDDTGFDTELTLPPTQNVVIKMPLSGKPKENSHPLENINSQVQ